MKKISRRNFLKVSGAMAAAKIFDILNKSLIILMQAYASCTLRKNVL